MALIDIYNNKTQKFTKMKFLNRLTIIVITVLFFSCQKEPIATFITSKNTAYIGESIKFTNQSKDAHTFNWDFDDETTSNEENPSHAFKNARTYNITLTATGNGGTSTFNKSITIKYPEPVANFSANKTKANTGEVILFTNSSKNANSYNWNFGDGTNSVEENPTHSFSTKGNYEVELTATGDGGTNITSKTIEITAPPIDGKWKAKTTESDSQLSSSSISFTVTGKSVKITSWSASLSVGYVFGSNWSATLSSDNSFSFSPKIGSLTLKYSIKLNSGSSGAGTLKIGNKTYKMEASR